MYPFRSFWGLGATRASQRPPGFHFGELFGPSASIWVPFWFHVGTIWASCWHHVGDFLEYFCEDFLQMLSPFWVSKGSKMTANIHKKRQKHNTKKHSERGHRKNVQKVTQGWPKGAIFMTFGILLGDIMLPAVCPSSFKSAGRSCNN